MSPMDREPLTRLIALSLFGVTPKMGRRADGLWSHEHAACMYPRSLQSLELHSRRSGHHSDGHMARKNLTIHAPPNVCSRALVVTILETRRAYQMAMSLAQRLLVEAGQWPEPVRDTAAPALAGSLVRNIKRHAARASALKSANSAFPGVVPGMTRPTRSRRARPVRDVVSIGFRDAPPVRRETSAGNGLMLVTREMLDHIAFTEVEGTSNLTGEHPHASPNR